MVMMKRARRVPDRAPNPIDVAVGRRIRGRRVALGLSQEKVGDLLGLSFQQVQKYEKGMNRVSGSRLVHIAQILRCDVGDLFTDENRALPPAERAEVAKIVPLVSNREALRIAEAFNLIEDHATRQALIRLLEALANLTPAEGSRQVAGVLFGASK